MRALVVDRARAGGVRLVADYRDPTPAAGEVLVRVDLAGICSTDLEIVKGYMGFTGVLGHEFVGTVVRGSQVLVGKRVVAEINCVPPGSAANCAAARKHAPDHTVLGIDRRDGVFADYVVVPVENCHVVPTGVNDRQAVFVELLAAACQVLEDCPVTAGMKVAVIGTGRLGMLCGQVLAANGCRPMMIGRNERTMTLCRNLGLPATRIEDVGDDGRWDVVVECSGVAAGLQAAIRLVRPRGAIVLKSTFAFGADVNLAPVVINEIRVIGSRCGPFDAALGLLERGAVRVEELIDAVFLLDKGEEAFVEAAKPGKLKVLIEPKGD